MLIYDILLVASRIVSHSLICVTYFRTSLRFSENNIYHKYQPYAPGKCFIFYLLVYSGDSLTKYCALS